MEDYTPLKIVQRFLKDYNLCKECIGRQFALIGTGYSNSTRAESLINTLIIQAHFKHINPNNQQKEDRNLDFLEDVINIATKVNYQPAQKLLIKEGIEIEFDDENYKCHLCGNIFLNLDQITNKILEETHEYEFQNFLMGTVVDPRIQDKEDEFRVRYKISSGEALKKNLNRVLGIRLSNHWEKPVEFDSPEININVGLKKEEYSIDIQSNPICIEGNYRKYVRGIPQTHWPHRPCRGKGCKECNFSGKQYETSIEELISPFFLTSAQGETSKFHGAGREDIDAKCLGEGRPFIVEIKQPKKRNLPLLQVEAQIVDKIGKQVDVKNLKIVPKSEIKALKSIGEETSKTYSVLIESEGEITSVHFDEKIDNLRKIIIGNVIYQRTPTRVLHRRVDKTREKKIYEIQGKWIDSHRMRFNIKAMGGTYIKELISGDAGRTIPSFTTVFETNMNCIELDVIEIQKTK